MKLMQFSVDVPEWTRYFCAIEVPEGTSLEEAKELAMEAYYEGNYREQGTRFLCPVECLDSQFNWPEELDAA